MNAAFAHQAGPASRSRDLSVHWGHVASFLGVVLAVPLFSVLGLSLPLPATVERIAAELVPFATAGTLVQPESRAPGARGAIVLASGELLHAGHFGPAGSRASGRRRAGHGASRTVGVLATPGVPHYEPPQVLAASSGNSSAAAVPAAPPADQGNTQPAAAASTPADSIPSGGTQAGGTQAGGTQAGGNSSSGNPSGGPSGGGPPQAGGPGGGGPPAVNPGHGGTGAPGQGNDGQGASGSAGTNGKGAGHSP